MGNAGTLFRSRQVMEAAGLVQLVDNELKVFMRILLGVACQRLVVG